MSVALCGVRYPKPKSDLCSDALGVEETNIKYKVYMHKSEITLVRDKVIAEM